MKSVRDIGNIKGKFVFVRADFNVPLVDGFIGNDFRIRKTLPTIDFLLGKGAKLVIGSHIGEEKTSLRPVCEYLESKYSVSFVENYYPSAPEVLKNSKSDIFLLENLRKYSEEKSNDEKFSKHIASFADFYVNEAFPASHRSHASIIGIPRYIPSFAGFVFEEEIENLSKAFHPDHPFLFILGGAKFETKMPLVKKFFSLADEVFIGGALANDFFRAKGLDTGSSLLSEEKLPMEDFLNKKLILPIDLVVKNGEMVSIKQSEDVRDGDVIADVGVKSIENLNSNISKSKFILWNGPLGNYENGFKKATFSLAKKIAKSSAKSIVGGGDTVASIASLGIEREFTFVSTGGGAMLDFLANETLPGIEALNNGK